MDVRVLTVFALVVLAGCAKPSQTPSSSAPLDDTPETSDLVKVVNKTSPTTDIEHLLNAPAMSRAPRTGSEAQRSPLPSAAV